MRFAEILAAFDGAEPESDRKPRLSRFWDQVSASGTPLVDPSAESEDLRDVTFLHRADPHVRSVRLVANRVTDKDRQHLGIMAHVPGTDIWSVTLSLPADLRCSYGFSPSTSSRPEPIGGPGRPGPAILVDPFNLDPPLTRPDQTGAGEGSSVFSGPLAPDQSVWQPAEDPHCVDDRDREVLGEVYPVRVSLPPSQSPAGLLVLFDGRQWFDHLQVHRAVAAAGLPPLAILGIGTEDQAERQATLAGNREFLHAIADELLPQIEAELSAAGRELPDSARRIIAGQSLGGLSALLMAHDRPDSFDAVLAHSPSLWWRPGGTATPADLTADDTDDWTAALFREAAPRRVEFHLAVGSREGLMIDHARRLGAVLTSQGCATSVSVYQGGHDYACWRVELIAGLRSVFG